MSVGYVNKMGYRIGFYPDHPLANTQGYVLEHRRVLFDHLGATDQPCNWCDRMLAWQSPHKPSKLCVDHLDGNKVNNDPDNLVPCCYACNTRRGSKGRLRLSLANCRKGHPFTPENEYWHKGQRTCRQCKRDSINRMRAKRKALGIRRQHRGPDLWP